MPIAVDIIEGATISEVINEGYSTIRVATVSGLSGSRERRMFDALEHPEVPRLKEFHPIIPDIRCGERSGRAVSSETVEVQLRYWFLPPDIVVFDQPTIEVGTVLVPVRTQRDINGQQLIVRHIFRETAADGTVTEREEVQGAEVDLQIPSTVLSYSRIETSDPYLKSQVFVGRINAAPVLGDPRGYWLCIRIQGRTVQGSPFVNAPYWEVSYEFQRNPESWLPFIVFIDPETDKPPPDIVLGEGLRQVEVIGYADFRLLDLTL